MKDFCIILADIRSVYNVGSVFRTADAVGATKVFLTGYTPAPLDRFGRERKDISKVALGAEKTVSWEHVPDPVVLIKRLHKLGFEIVSVEQSGKSINYKEFKPRAKTAFVFGNETKGLPEEILKESDSVIEIPMRGTKESLNVSVSVGVILFEYL